MKSEPSTVLSPFDTELGAVQPTGHSLFFALTNERHNNKMERMNGEIRDREKTFRGLKNPDSPFFRGYQIYHDYIRPHEALDGDTPADRVGIRVEGQNKWITIIQNATKANVADGGCAK